MAIRNESLTTGGSNIFLCAADQEQAVTCIVFCNYSVATATISVYAIPAGVSGATTASLVIKELELPASETFTFDTEKFVLSAGDRLYATASANSSVTATVSSMRVS